MKIGSVGKLVGINKARDERRFFAETIQKSANEAENRFFGVAEVKAGISKRSL